MIEIIDNFLPKNFEDQLEKSFQNQSNINIPLYYTPNITSSNMDEFLPSFSSEFYPNPRGVSNFLMNVLYYFSFNRNFYISNILRAKAICQVPPLNPGPNKIHVDFFIPHLVLLYYVHDSDGDTILFDENDNEIKRVTPKKGRAIFFEGSIKHCSSSPTKGLRSILNFNFETINL